MAVDIFPSCWLHSWIRLLLLVLLFLLQNKVRTVSKIELNAQPDLFLQDVRPLPDGVLFRLHGRLQSQPRHPLRDHRLHGNQVGSRPQPRSQAETRDSHEDTAVISGDSVMGGILYI